MTRQRGKASGRVGRWLLVPVAAAGIWYVALLSGLVAVGVLDALCPAEQMISGFCTAPWHATAIDVLVGAYAAATAFGIVVVCGFLAPANKFTVALIASSAAPSSRPSQPARARCGRPSPQRPSAAQPGSSSRPLDGGIV